MEVTDNALPARGKAGNDLPPRAGLVSQHLPPV